MSTSDSDVVMGIWIGGQAKRLGGVQKALLQPPESERGDTLLERLLRLGRAAGLEVVLVGQAELGSIAADIPQLPDAKAGFGPLAGLEALFAHAGQRRAIALACDMPYVSLELLRRLLSEEPTAALLAPRDPETGKWQPLFARYASSILRPVLDTTFANAERSFQQLFARSQVTELVLSDSEHAQLRDWDTPEDVAAAR